MPSGNAGPVGCTKIIYLSRITLVGNATIAISNQVGTTISYAIYLCGYSLHIQPVSSIQVKWWKDTLSPRVHCSY